MTFEGAAAEDPTLTFVPLFGEPYDSAAAGWLRGVANPAAGVPLRVATMPRSGPAFFLATGDDARQLDLVWGQVITADTTPVVITLHDPALPPYLEGLDAAFVIGRRGGDPGGLYTAFPHVQVVDSDDPAEVVMAAARAWNRADDPTFLFGEPAPEPGRQEPRRDDDVDFFDTLFGDAAGDASGGESAPASDPWGPLPSAAAAGEAAAAAGVTAALDPDPLAALAALKPVPLERGDHGEPGSVADPEAAGGGDGDGSLGFLRRARLALGRRRAIEVPGEIGDLLLGTRPAPLVVVGSRKGGVGKTALAAGLAQVAGYALDGRAGIAALVDQNINNADQWGRLLLPEGVTTVREVMAQLEQGREFPGAPAYARTPALAVFPESRDPGDGYPPVLIQRFVQDLRSRYVLTVVDLPNALPAFSSAESSVAASYIGEADLVVVPTTDDPNALRGALEYLETASMRSKAAVVPYIVSPERGIRDHPKVLDLLDAIRERAVAVVPFPKTEKATLAVVQGTSVLDVDTRLRNAYIDLAATVARVLVRGL